MEQTVTIPIALGSKAFAISRRFNEVTGSFEPFKIVNVKVTQVVLWGNGKVRHYVSGNFLYLPENVFATREEAERVLRVAPSSPTESA